MGERDHRRKRKLCILVSLMEILCCFLIKMPHIFIWQRVPQIMKSHLPPWPGGSVPLLQLQISNTFVILIPVNPQPFFFQTFFFQVLFFFHVQLSDSQRAAFIFQSSHKKCHRLDEQTNRNLFYHCFRDWKTDIKVSVFWVPPRPLSLAGRKPEPPHEAFPLQAHP